MVLGFSIRGERDVLSHAEPRNNYHLQQLSSVTSVVLWSSDRLPGHAASPIINTLWLGFSVRFRVGSRGIFCPQRWSSHPVMRKGLQLALMASTVIATFLSLTTPYVQAEPGASSHPAGVITTNDENGRKVYVNEGIPASTIKRSQAAPSPRRSLVYWSVTKHRWKAVPPANGATMRAARSAAAEVNQYLGQEPQAVSGAQASDFVRGKTFTQQELDAAIDEAAARHNVDPNLVRSVIKVESNFNPNAVSSKGAMGLMQLMPSTARQLKVTNPFDPQQNVDAGVRHLKKLLESYGGDVKLSLAAYNAGAGAVARSAGIPRFAETQNYVRRITNLYYGGSDPGTHVVGNPSHDPILVQRDAKGVLYISNTD